MSFQPEGENLRNAVKWISSQRQENPSTPLSRLIDQASMTYNLTPLEADSLQRLLSNPIDEEE